MTAIHLELVGGQAAIDDVEGIGSRMVHARPAFTEIAHVIERGEKRLFAGFGGKYVRTGTVRDSLTQEHANNAIRDIHSDGAGLTFGSKVWYAHFLKKPGTTKSAVLTLQPKTSKQAKQVMLDWITGRSA